MTLLETLVTVALSVLLATLAFPAMERAARSLGEAETRVTLVSDMRVARADARRFGRPVTLAPLGDGARYRVGATLRDLPQGTRLTTPRGRPLVFHADGSVDGDRAALASSRGTTVVTIDPSLGLVRVAGAL